MKILKVYKEAFFCNKRIIMLKGGRGSGKSNFAAQKILTRILTETSLNVLVVRKFASTIRGTVFKLFCELIVKENLEKRFSINNTNFIITDKINGNSILFHGVDNPEKLKSLQNIRSIWAEEISELEESDWDNLLLCVRGKYKNIKQFIGTFNPIDQNHWLKKKYFDVENEDVYTLSTTYLDNPFLDDDYIKLLTVTLKGNENLYRISTLGEWGIATAGGELFHKFKFSSHVSNDCNYNPQLPIHVSLDFNTQPFCTMSIWQINGKQLNCIDEITLPHPNNNTRYMCKEFVRKFNSHVSGLFVYGDASGLANDTRSEKGFNDFVIVTQELIKFKPQLRLPTKNPSVVMSVNFINSIFEIEFEDIQINISTKCHNMIKDLTYLKQSPEGGKLIEKEKNKETGAVYEKYGHCTDTLRYLTTVCFAREYTIYQTGVKPFTNLRVGTKTVAKNGY